MFAISNALILNSYLSSSGYGIRLAQLALARKRTEPDKMFLDFF